MKIGIFNGNREHDIIIYFVLAQLAAQKTPLHTQTQKQDPIQNKQELCIDQLRTKPTSGTAVLAVVHHTEVGSAVQSCTTPATTIQSMLSSLFIIFYEIAGTSPDENDGRISWRH